MNPLIPKHLHEIGGVLQEAVDARDLWKFFQPRSTFSNWMHRKIVQHRGFAEGVDYVRVRVHREREHILSTRISYQVDYMVTVAMAEAIGDLEFCRGPNSWK